ncbi:hypothetical protein [Rossellomorea sp. DUT-2]|uniref:hypothetical protein n=1 Tax=Rossellomorea sp. DUT-2 TaxID=3412021 RepID=UPI003D184C7A
MNKKTFCILLTVLVVLSGACSNSDQSVKSSTVSTNKGERNAVDPDQSESTNDNEYRDEKIQPLTKAENKSETNKNQSPTIHESKGDKNTPSKNSHNQLDTVREPENDETGFDVSNYLNKNYPIGDAHYKTSTWENEDIGRKELTVNILPNTKEYGEEIDDVFKNGSPFVDDERTIAMKEVAEDIMLELPEAYDNIHVDSVSWVSYDGEFAVTLIQDYR